MNSKEGIKRYLAENKTKMLNKWYQILLETYPAQTANFLKREKNQFSNPVGHNLYHGLEGVYDGLYQGLNLDEVLPFLDEIIRIRAVQDFTPAQALQFITNFKDILRKELSQEIKGGRITYEELLEFEKCLDELMLLSFDTFAGCREKIYELRISEFKNRTSRLFRRAGITIEEEQHDLQ